MIFLWLIILLPPTAVGFVSLKLLEFGHSNNFYLLFVQRYECSSGKKKNQMNVRFSLKNSTL